jgi:hypothetical protein
MVEAESCDATLRCAFGRSAMRKVNKELWLLLSLVVIAALLNFLVSSQRVVLCFFFLPTLYSAYNFGRRHATLTAVASVFLVVLLSWMNPTLFNRRVASLQRSIPVLMMEQKLTGAGASTADAPLEVQVLALADAYETMISDSGARKLSPVQAEEVIVKSSGKRYDSMVVDAFVKAFGEHAKGARA